MVAKAGGVPADAAPLPELDPLYDTAKNNDGAVDDIATEPVQINTLGNHLECVEQRGSTVLILVLSPTMDSAERGTHHCYGMPASCIY